MPTTPPSPPPVIGEPPPGPGGIITDIIETVGTTILPGLVIGSSLIGMANALTGSLASLPHVALAALTQSVAGGALPILGFHGLHAAALSMSPRYGFLAARRYRAALGRVARAESNEPLRGAVVTLQDSLGKPRHTVRTRDDGTFSFLLPPGAYQLSVTLPGFVFEPHPRNLALLPNEKVYDGRPFTVEPPPRGGESLMPPLVVALRLVAGTRRFHLGATLRNLWTAVRTVQTHVAIPLLLLGSVYNSILLLLHPSVLLIVFEILYGALLATELLLSRVIRRVVGRVRDAVRKNPIPLTIVRLLEEKTGRIVQTLITSPRGAFLVLPRPGVYRLQAAHPAYLPYEQRIHVRSWAPGAAALTVSLAPRSPT